MRVIQVFMRIPYETAAYLATTTVFLRLAHRIVGLRSIPGLLFAIACVVGFLYRPSMLSMVHMPLAASHCTGTQPCSPPLAQTHARPANSVWRWVGLTIAVRAHVLHV